MCRTNNLFTVYKKHNPPRPHDEVWRLKKIAKDGVFHRSLRDANVRTVREFLRLLNDDRNTLRRVSNGCINEMFFKSVMLIVSFYQILQGMSDKAWKVAVRHAMTCSHGEEQFPPCQGHQQMETVSSGGHYAMQQGNLTDLLFLIDLFSIRYLFLNHINHISS